MTFVVSCLEDIAARIDSLGELGKKVFSVYSEEDLFDKAAALTMPAVGIMYEGLTAADDPSRQGMAAEARIAIVLILDGKTLGNLDRKNEAARLLDEIRKSIRLSASPTGHRWKFLSEIPMGQMNGLLVYVQRWGTSAPLTN